MLKFSLTWSELEKGAVVQKSAELVYDAQLDLFYNEFGFLVSKEALKNVINTKMTPAEKAAVTNPVMVAIIGEAAQMPEE
jgi:hypothetical protein